MATRQFSHCYRVLAEALLASDDPGKIAAFEDAAAAHATGVRAGLHFHSCSASLTASGRSGQRRF